MSSSDKPGGLLDGLTSMDETLESVRTRLSDLHTTAGEIRDAVVSIDECTSGERDASQIEMSTNVPADTDTDDPESTKRQVPDNVRTVNLIVGWPSGANNRVGVRLIDEDENVLFPANPEDDYVAASDFTYPFTLRRDVSQGTTVIAQFINTDTNNDHFINVILEYEVKE